MNEVDAEVQELDILKFSKKMKQYVLKDCSKFSENDFVDVGLGLGELADGTPEPNADEYKRHAYTVKRNPATVIRLVERLVSLDEDLVRVREDKKRTAVIELDKVRKLIKWAIDAIDDSTDRYELGEYEKLLADVIGPALPDPVVWGFDGVGYGAWALQKNANGLSNGEQLNAAVRRLKTVVNSVAFKKKLELRKQRSEERRRSISELFAYFFDRHSRLLVCRIDFHFKKELKPNITPAECSKLFGKFTKGLKDRSDLDKGRLGYAAVLEINRARHYHIHAFIIYNGAVRDNPRFMCEQLGEYWKKVTDNVGYSHDCSLTWRNEYHKAIGVIDYTNEEKLKELFTVAIPYLCKGDEYFRVIAKGSRTFWRSEISVERQRKFASKPGPKRSKDVAPALKAVKTDP